MPSKKNLLVMALVAGAVLYAYNRVPAVRSILGAAV